MNPPSIPYNSDNLLDFVEEAAAELKGAHQAVWLDQLEEEHSNLCALISQCIEWQDAAAALRLCAALQTFWRIQGHIAEGLKLSAAALELDDESIDPALRASVLNGTGVLARMQGDYESARNYHEQRMAIRREIGDKAGMASCFTGLGNVRSAKGNYAAASAYYEQSMAIKQQIGDRQGIGGSLNNLGFAAQRNGDSAAAERCYEQSLEIWRTDGNPQRIALSLQGFAEVAAMKLDWQRAARLWGAADAMRKQSGTGLPPSEQRELEKDLAKARRVIGDDAFTTEWQSGAAMIMDQVIEYALRLFDRCQ